MIPQTCFHVFKTTRIINIHKSWLLLVLMLTTVLSGTLRADNMILNSSFEEGPEDAPAQWQPSTWAGSALFHTSSEKQEGQRSIMIVSRTGADAGWKAVVPVEPQTVYRLTGWIKTDQIVPGSSRGALLNVHELYGVETKPLTGTQDWTQVQVLFNSNNRRKVTINCLFGGWGQATGKAWYDNIRLERVSDDQQKNTVVIDITKTAHRISPLMYGQLIEHVGRGVYGGMWAEMLEDRKFYFPISDEFEGWINKGGNYADDAYYTELAGSPWRVVGPKGRISMTQEAFVGTQAPQIVAEGADSPTGIEQGELAIIQGKTYLGHIVLAGEPGAAPVQVSLIWGNDKTQRQVIVINKLRNNYVEYPLEFTAGQTTDNARLEIVALGKETVRIGCVSLMPSDNVNGWRKEVIALMKELNATLYKWPGGNFVSGYNWQDGIGPRDNRPPRANPAWKGIEDNDVGLHEYLELCQMLEAEPTLAVNAGSGDAQSAAQLVEYVNGSTKTPMGKLRSNNGHAKPYGVRYFYIGNEMWGTHQVGYVPLAQYVKKHNDIVKSMRSVDSSIKVIAVGRAGDWSQKMFEACSGNMDYITDNFYATSSENLVEHIKQPPAAVRRITNSHRRLGGENRIPLIIDEWGYWYGKHKYGQLGIQYHFQDALGLVSGLHEMYRNSDVIEIVHYAQAVNALGAIKTSKTEAVWDVPGLVLKLYRNEFGSIPIRIENSTPSLDISAALSEDKKYLTISVVNTAEQAQKLTLDIPDILIKGQVNQYTLKAASLQDINEPGKNPKIEVVGQSLSILPKTLEIPPLSVTLYKCQIN